MDDITTRKLAAIQKSLREVKGNMATKADLTKMATKDDIKNMATKADLTNMATKADLKGMATKADVKSLESRLRDEMNKMATKDDLKNLEIKLLEKIDDSQMEIIAVVDKHKADKETVEVLEKRVKRLEDNAGFPTLD